MEKYAKCIFSVIAYGYKLQINLVALKETDKRVGGGGVQFFLFNQYNFYIYSLFCIFSVGRGKITVIPRIIP